MFTSLTDAQGRYLTQPGKSYGFCPQCDRHVFDCDCDEGFDVEDCLEELQAAMKWLEALAKRVAPPDLPRLRSEWWKLKARQLALQGR